MSQLEKEDIKKFRGATIMNLKDKRGMENTEIRTWIPICLLFFPPVIRSKWKSQVNASHYQQHHQSLGGNHPWLRGADSWEAEKRKIREPKLTNNYSPEHWAPAEPQDRENREFSTSHWGNPKFYLDSPCKAQWGWQGEKGEFCRQWISALTGSCLADQKF